MKFKIGDRVAVYSKGGRSVGKIDGISNETDKVHVQFTNGASDGFHPKQCRRLVKKERKRVKLRFDAYGVVSYIDNSTYHQIMRVLPGNDFIEFIEVKKKR